MTPNVTKIDEINTSSIELFAPTSPGSLQLTKELNDKLTFLASKINEVIKQVNKLSDELGK